MEKIEWSDDYSVGVEVLDEQHKAIFKLINQLADTPNLSVRSRAIADALSELSAYTTRHLEYEERLMEQYGYPELEQHRESHIEFAKSIGSMIVAEIEQCEEVPQQLLGTLNHWLVNHILNEDLKYRPFFEAKGIH